MPRNNSDFLLFGEQTARLAFRKVLDSDFDDWLRFCAFPDSLKYSMPNNERTPEENSDFGSTELPIAMRMIWVA
jgi:hypothetical protein